MSEMTLRIAQTIGLGVMVVGGVVLGLAIVAIPFASMYERIPMVRWWNARGVIKNVDKTGKYAVGMWAKSGFVPLADLLEAYESKQESSDECVNFRE